MCRNARRLRRRHILLDLRKRRRGTLPWRVLRRYSDGCYDLVQRTGVKKRGHHPVLRHVPCVDPSSHYGRDTPVILRHMAFKKYPYIGGLR